MNSYIIIVLNAINKQVNALSVTTILQIYWMENALIVKMDGLWMMSKINVNAQNILIWKTIINARIIINTKVDTPKTTHQILVGSFWRFKLLPNKPFTIKKQTSTQLASELVQKPSRNSQIQNRIEIKMEYLTKFMTNLKITS